MLLARGNATFPDTPTSRVHDIRVALECCSCIAGAGKRACNIQHTFSYCWFVQAKPSFNLTIFPDISIIGFIFVKVGSFFTLCVTEALSLSFSTCLVIYTQSLPPVMQVTSSPSLSPPHSLPHCLSPHRCTPQYINAREHAGCRIKERGEKKRGRRRRC